MKNHMANMIIIVNPKEAIKPFSQLMFTDKA